MRKRAGGATIWALAAGACLGSGAAPARAQFAGLPGGGPASFAPLVRAVAPEVVGITVQERQGRHHIAIPLPPSLRDTPLGRRLEQQNDQSQDSAQAVEAAGSGFIIDPAGYIVTNNHVVGDASSIEVALNDGRHVRGTLIGTDQLTDLAVIKIDAGHRLQAAQWGDSGQMHVGDWILAAGNPFALGNSYTAGIISAEGRNIGDGPFDHFLQLDAPINPGNSGGPSFNMQGAVVGVNTAIVSPSGGSVGIGFAIPSDTAKRIVAEIIAHGGIARGWLGISVGDAANVAPSGASRGGAIITGIERDGPAGKAGLEAGDEVLSANGAAVQDADDLIRAVASVPPGAAVHLTVLRNGRTLEIRVVVGRRPAQIGQ